MPYTRFDHNSWITEYHKTVEGYSTQQGPYDMFTEDLGRYSFSGYNMHFGLLWDINRHLSLGAVLKTPFTAKLKHEQRFLSNLIFENEEYQDESDIVYHPQMDEQKLKMPMAYGLGLAIKPTDRLLFDIDIYRIEWDGFVLRNAQGVETSPITGEEKGVSSIKPTHHVRVGGEYVFLLKKITLTPRMGLFLDPEPAEGSPDDYYGIGLGVGITFGPFAIDWAYQYRFGDNVEGDSRQGFSSPADVKQHLFYNSIIYYF